MDWTDSAAAEAARTGDQRAFRVLVERHSRSVFRLAFRMTGNEQDAEDSVQETFLRAYKQLHRFDGRSAFGTWLYRIAVNCSLDLIRARKSRHELQASPTSGETFDWLDQASSHAPSPERLAQSRQVATALKRAPDELTCP